MKDPAYIAVSKKSKHKGVVPRLEKALSDMRRVHEIELIERSFLEALARDGVIEGGAECIDVRPRSLLARGGGVLLVGAVARLDERAHGLGVRGDLAAGRAEMMQ